MGEEAQCGVGSVHSVLADLSHSYPFRAFSTSTPQSELGNLDVSQRVAGARLPNGIHEGQHGQQTRATRMQTVQRLHVVRSTAQPSVRSLLQLRHALVPLLHHFLIVRHVLPFSSALFATLRCSSNPCNDCSNTPRTRWFSFVSTLHLLGTGLLQIELLERGQREVKVHLPCNKQSNSTGFVVGSRGYSTVLRVPVARRREQTSCVVK